MIRCAERGDGMGSARKEILRLCAALRANGRQSLEVPADATGAVSGACVDDHTDRTGAGQTLQAGRQVGGVADRGPERPVRRPDVPHDGAARRDPYPDSEGLIARGVHLSDRLNQRETGFYGRALFLRERTGGAEYGHHAVSGELDHRAAVLLYDGGSGLGIAIDGLEDLARLALKRV